MALISSPAVEAARLLGTSSSPTALGTATSRRGPASLLSGPSAMPAAAPLLAARPARLPRGLVEPVGSRHCDPLSQSGLSLVRPLAPRPQQLPCSRRRPARLPRGLRRARWLSAPRLLTAVRPLSCPAPRLPPAAALLLATEACQVTQRTLSSPLALGTATLSRSPASLLSSPGLRPQQLPCSWSKAC